MAAYMHRLSGFTGSSARTNTQLHHSKLDPCRLCVRVCAWQSAKELVKSDHEVIPDSHETKQKLHFQYVLRYQ